MNTQEVQTHIPAQPFTMLGYDRATYVARLSTGERVKFNSSGRIRPKLLQLAPVEYWAAAYPSTMPISQEFDCFDALDAVIRQAEAAGPVDPWHLRQLPSLN